MSVYDRCRIHGTILHDYNGFGEPFYKPLCLECRWESGKGPMRVRVVKGTVKTAQTFLLHWGETTAYVYRSFTNRLSRMLGVTVYNSLDELAFMAGRGPTDVLAKLRKFEETHHAKRTKRSREDKREYDRQVAREMHRVERTLSLDDPAVARAVDWTTYHEQGGARKR